MQTFNLFNGETDTGPDGTEPPGYLCHAARLGSKLGASLLGMSIYDLPPGEAICPFHFEWTLRRLGTGELVSLTAFHA